MTVEFTPKSDNCFCFGIANGTWFTLCEEALDDIIDWQRTNDPLDVDAETSLKCAVAIKDWTPPESWWGINGKELEIKLMITRFFESCGGFTTH